MIECYLKEIMQKKGFTYRALAEAIGKPENYAANLHRFANSGKYMPGIDVIDKVCEVLDCQPGELLRYVKE